MGSAKCVCAGDDRDPTPRAEQPIARFVEIVLGSVHARMDERQLAEPIAVQVTQREGAFSGLVFERVAIPEKDSVTRSRDDLDQAIATPLSDPNRIGVK